jgi:hypothetical protein
MLLVWLIDHPGSDKDREMARAANKNKEELCI